MACSGPPSAATTWPVPQPLAVADVIEQENLIDNAKKMGDYLIAELRKLPNIKEVRGRGLMIGIDCSRMRLGCARN